MEVGLGFSKRLERDGELLFRVITLCCTHSHIMRFSFFHASHEDISNISHDNHSDINIEVSDGMPDPETYQVASDAALLAGLIDHLQLDRLSKRSTKPGNS